jgi:dipeptide/tripeptide permease
MDVYFGIVIIHVLVGFLLVYFAAKAYKKTKYMPMLFLTLGFFLIVIGDTLLGDLLGISDKNIQNMIEEITEISGFVLVIIAVIKS